MEWDNVQCNLYKDMHLCTGVRVILTLVSCLLHKQTEKVIPFRVVPWTTELVSGKIHAPHGDENLVDITFFGFHLPCLLWTQRSLQICPNYIYPHVPRSKHGGWSGWSTIGIPNILAISTQITLMGVGQHPSKAACWHKSSDLLG